MLRSQSQASSIVRILLDVLLCYLLVVSADRDRFKIAITRGLLYASALALAPLVALASLANPSTHFPRFLINLASFSPR